MAYFWWSGGEFFFDTQPKFVRKTHTSSIYVLFISIEFPQLLSHLFGMHKQTWAKQRAQCGKCNIWLNDRSELKKHLEEHPTEAHKCPHCEKISPTANALKCHIRGVHAERSHKCGSCDKSFRNVTALKV